MTTLGILGAGQLGKMLTEAASHLNIETILWDSNPEACAKQVATVLTAPYNDEETFENFTNQVDHITWEFENVPVALTQKLQLKKPISPNPKILAITQDRLHEKDFLKALGLKTATYQSLERIEGLNMPLPLIIKTRCMGYDGKGQYRIKTQEDLKQIPKNTQALIAESWVNFEYECSIVSVRSQEGEIKYYDLSENIHKDGILATSEVKKNHPLQEKAQEIAKTILEKTNYIGVLAIEFFVVNNNLLINELAPRVHNSGHWTIEGAKTSQFENHIRAVLGMPLGDTSTIGSPKMTNLIGTLPKDLPFEHIHLYGKSERPGRKIGHFTTIE